MKLALLVDSDKTISQWQFEALREAVSSGHEISLIVFKEDNRNSPRRKSKHALYYLFALLSRYRISLLRRIPISELRLKDVEAKGFQAEPFGMWEKIPENFLNNFYNSDILIKFGMGLLKDPHTIPTKFGVISYHHGDPSNYRGRPAGFWESMHSAAIMGVIVQSLSNILDGGVIRAVGYSRINQTSYRSTLSSAYKTGIPLLNLALNQIEKGEFIHKELSKNTFTLPSNLEVLELIVKQVKNSILRYFYGAFIEKKWRVGRVTKFRDFEAEITVESKDIELIPVPKGYMMTADPCGEKDGGLYCELLNNKSGLGEIGLWRNGEWAHLDIGVSGHISYPQIVSENGNCYIFPEVASISSPILLKLEKNGTPSGEKILLKGLENFRLVDGTLFKHGSYWYLFAGKSPDSHQRLDLYFAKSLFDKFETHPMSPIILDPRRSRMAGPIHEFGDAIYRFSQNCSERYGGGITVSRITNISTKDYEESIVGTVNTRGVFGPHTLLAGIDEVWLDFYNEKFALAAGIRRLKAKFS